MQKKKKKKGFLHFNNSFFVQSCEWIYFFKVKNLLKITE